MLAIPSLDDACSFIVGWVIILLKDPSCDVLLPEQPLAFRKQSFQQDLLVLTLGDVPGRLALQILVLDLLLAGASHKVQLGDAKFGDTSIHIHSHGVVHLVDSSLGALLHPVASLLVLSRILEVELFPVTEHNCRPIGVLVGFGELHTF